MTPEERDQLCQVAGVPPTVDNVTLGDALIEAIHEAIDEYGEAEVHARARRGVEAHKRRQAAEQGTPPAPPAPPTPPAEPTGTMPASDAEAVAWAVRTGRIGLARADFWTRELEAERNASGSIARGWATLQSLAPVWADGSLDPFGDVGPISATPLLDAMDRALYGPTREQVDAEVDRQAEAEARAMIDRERADRVRDVRRSQLIREHRAHSARIAAELDGLDPEDEELHRQLYPPEPKPKPADRRPRQETYGITARGLVRNDED